MRLSFTTLGCPDWDLDTILTRAGTYGFDAVDFRGLQGEMNIYKLPDFSAKLQETVKRFEDAGLAVSCFSSSARLVSHGQQVEEHLDEIRRYRELCAAFGTRYIRVFGGGTGDTPRADAIAIAAEHLRQMAEIAADQDVTVIIETHDDWLKAVDVKAVLDGASAANAGVLWDIHHPYRMVGEPPEETLDILGRSIQYTHWKDSRVEGDGHRYCLLGQGDIPLGRIHTLLSQGGYAGYYTLEWEKKWHPEIEPPEVAFPQFVRFMRELESG